MEEKDLADHLNSLLKYNLEYIGIINAQGRILEQAPKNLDLSKEKMEILCMGTRLQHSMHADFDEELGTVNYIATERSKLKFISIPIFSNVIIAIAKKGMDCTPLIQKINSKQFRDMMKNKLGKYNIVAAGIRH
ncbi:MAG: hypothetical protein KGH99_02285 [Thaumarchaeota archaeon]|nr:hypothetical protein [Nitrososphaerota archaeon]MDE1872287.1 hypothetical protein [Nitrososphaerota archaeon]